MLRNDVQRKGDRFDSYIIDVVRVRHADEQSVSVFNHVKQQASKLDAGMATASSDAAGSRDEPAVHSFGADGPRTAIRGQRHPKDPYTVAMPPRSGKQDVVLYLFKGFNDVEK